jgi:hypothetical protein
LERFLDISDAFELDGLKPSHGEHDPAKLSISGVQVSVRPDVILHGTYRGKPVVGALKFHFAKTNELTEEAGLNVTTVLQQYVSEHLVRGSEIVSARHCAVLDVFSKCWHRAPAAFQMRRRSIEAACQEIALWWSTA